MGKFFTTRVWILLAFLLFAVISINPRPWANGIMIQGVGEGSTEAHQGFTAGEKILTINNQPITTQQAYHNALQAYTVIPQNITITTTTTTSTYTITTNIGFTVDENLTITPQSDPVKISAGKKKHGLLEF